MNYKAHNTAIIDEGARIGDGTSIWHYSHVMSTAVLGSNCTVGQNVFVAANVIIGNFVKIQNNVSLYEGVELEDYVFCGPSMVFTNILAPRCLYPQRGSNFYLTTRVRRGASIGANVTILCGNSIGMHSMIGAGSVVTHDVPDYALMIGSPARFVAWICECGNKVEPVGHNTFKCPICSKMYNFSPQSGALSKKNLEV